MESASSKDENEVPLGSPISPILGRQSAVRKRGAALTAQHAVPRLSSSPTKPSHTFARPRINHTLIYNDYKAKGPTSLARKFVNFIAAIGMVFLPLSIFVIPLWWHAPTYPRVVVAITTSQDRLDLLEPTLMTILNDNDSLQPSVVYVVLSEVHHNNAFPAFLKKLMTPDDETTTAESGAAAAASSSRSGNSKPRPLLQIVSPPPSVPGHSTVYASALAALQAEEHFIESSAAAAASKEEDVLITEHSILRQTGVDIGGKETRILVWDDRFPYSASTLEAMVQASQWYPDAVLSSLGGDWKSKFRQVKRVLGVTGLLDKPPNVLLHSVQKLSHGSNSMILTKPTTQDVLLLDSCAGIMFRVGRLLPELPNLMDRIDSLAQQVNEEGADDSSILWDMDAGDVLWSGLLETLNITRTIVSLPTTTTTGVNVTSTTTLSRRHWMTAAMSLQHHWKIWQSYQFLDWSTLSEEQIEAMECEGSYPQDCSEPRRNEDAGTKQPPPPLFQKGVCRPNAAECGGEYGSILMAMMSEDT